MCIIVYKPAGIGYDTLLNKRLINECRRDNPDGFGAIWMAPDGFTTAIQYLERDPWHYLSEDIEFDYTNYNIALHFRFATHGAINRDNLHPFGSWEQGFWMHNGALPLQPTNRDESDSSLYYRSVIEPVISNYSITQDLSEYIDCLECLTPAGSRFLFMSPTLANYAILTGSGWVQDNNGLWFSHGGYL